MHKKQPQSKQAMHAVIIKSSFCSFRLDSSTDIAHHLTKCCTQAQTLSAFNSNWEFNKGITYMGQIHVDAFPVLSNTIFKKHVPFIFVASITAPHYNADQNEQKHTSTAGLQSKLSHACNIWISGSKPLLVIKVLNVRRPLRTSPSQATRCWLHSWPKGTTTDKINHSKKAALSSKCNQQKHVHTTTLPATRPSKSACPLQAIRSSTTISDLSSCCWPQPMKCILTNTAQALTASTKAISACINQSINQVLLYAFTRSTPPRLWTRITHWWLLAIAPGHATPFWDNIFTYCWHITHELFITEQNSFPSTHY